MTLARGVSGVWWRWKDSVEVESRVRPFLMNVRHPPGTFPVLDASVAPSNVRIFEHPPPKFSH